MKKNMKRFMFLALVFILVASCCQTVFASEDGVRVFDSMDNLLDNSVTPLPEVICNTPLHIVFDDDTELPIGENNAGITLKEVNNLTVGHFPKEAVNGDYTGVRYQINPQYPSDTNQYKRLFYEVRLKINDLPQNTADNFYIRLQHEKFGMMPDENGIAGRITFGKTADGVFQYYGKGTRATKTTFNNSEWITVKMELNVDQTDTDNYLKSRMIINNVLYGGDINGWADGSSNGGSYGTQAATRLILNPRYNAAGTDVYIDYVRVWSDKMNGNDDDGYLIKREDLTIKSNDQIGQSTTFYSNKGITEYEPISFGLEAKGSSGNTYTVTPTSPLTVGNTYELTIPANVSGNNVPVLEKKVKFIAVAPEGIPSVTSFTTASGNKIEEGDYIGITGIPLMVNFEDSVPVDADTLEGGVTLEEVEELTIAKTNPASTASYKGVTYRLYPTKGEATNVKELYYEIKLRIHDLDEDSTVDNFYIYLSNDGFGGEDNPDHGKQTALVKFAKDGDGGIWCFGHGGNRPRYNPSTSIPIDKGVWYTLKGTVNVDETSENYMKSLIELNGITVGNGWQSHGGTYNRSNWVSTTLNILQRRAGTAVDFDYIRLWDDVHDYGSGSYVVNSNDGTGWNTNVAEFLATGVKETQKKPVLTVGNYDGTSNTYAIEPQNALSYLKNYRLTVTEDVCSQYGTPLLETMVVNFIGSYANDIGVTATSFDEATKTAYVTIDNTGGSFPIWILTKVSNGDTVKAIDVKKISLISGSQTYSGNTVPDYTSDDTVDIFVWGEDTLFPMSPKSYGLTMNKQ